MNAQADSRPRVLVVDDEPTNLTVLVELLCDEHHVQVAKNGEQALVLAVGDPRPELILLDVMMPAMDGFEVCRRLKADAATRDIPIIFVTALDDYGNEARGLELGAVDYITKPIQPELVRERVRTQIELFQHRQFVEMMIAHTEGGLDLSTPAREALGRLKSAEP